MGECFFWYRLTQVVPDKVLSRKMVVVVVAVAVAVAGVVVLFLFAVYSAFCLDSDFLPGYCVLVFLQVIQNKH